MPRTPRVPCSLGLGSTLCVSEAPCGSERSKGSSEAAPRELLARVNCSFCAHHVLIMCAMRAHGGRVLLLDQLLAVILQFVPEPGDADSQWTRNDGVESR